MSFCEQFCKRIHETKGQFNTLRLWGSACFVECASCILLALHGVCGNTHVTTNNTKRTRLKNNCKKIKIYYYCHTAFVIGWFDVLEMFLLNFQRINYFYCYYKKISNLFCSHVFSDLFLLDPAVPICRMLPFDEGQTHILSTAKQPQKAQRIIYSDSSRSLFYSEIANDICSTMC